MWEIIQVFIHCKKSEVHCTEPSRKSWEKNIKSHICNTIVHTFISELKYNRIKNVELKNYVYFPPLYLNQCFEFYVNILFQWLHLSYSQADSKPFPYDHIISSFSGCAEQCAGIKQENFVISWHGRLNKGPYTHRQSGPHSHHILYLWHTPHKT